ncbi:hypothetical protein OG937_44800 [Streptomyces sp. NBC_00510]
MDGTRDTLGLWAGDRSGVSLQPGYLFRPCELAVSAESFSIQRCT